jgi:hypothetical protein
MSISCFAIRRDVKASVTVHVWWRCRVDGGYLRESRSGHPCFYSYEARQWSQSCLSLVLRSTVWHEAMCVSCIHNEDHVICGCIRENWILRFEAMSDDHDAFGWPGASFLRSSVCIARLAECVYFNVIFGTFGAMDACIIYKHSVVTILDWIKARMIDKSYPLHHIIDIAVTSFYFVHSYKYFNFL